MVVDKPSNAPVPQRTPPTDAKAPKTEPKKPQDNIAAKQAPKETRSAVDNTFGKMPQGETAKQPDSTAKSPPVQPKTSNLVVDNKQLPATDAKGQPVKTPDGRSVVLDKNQNPIPVESDGKASTNPKGKTYAVNDAGKYVETADGKDGVYDKNGNTVAADPLTGEVARNANGHSYALNANGGYLQSEDGKEIVVDKYSGKLVVVDPGNAASGGIYTAKDGNPYVVRPDGKYATVPGLMTFNRDGSQNPTRNFSVVYDRNSGNKPAAINDGTGQLVKTYGGLFGAVQAVDPTTGTFIKTPDGKSVGYDQDGRLIVSDDRNSAPYAALPNGDYAKTEDGKQIAYSKDLGGKPIALDPWYKLPETDGYGNALALDANGKYLKTPDGKEVIYDKNNNGNLAFFDEKTTKAAADGSGNPYAVSPDGSYTQTADGHYVVHDKANGNNLVAIDGQTGQAITNGQGRPLAIDEYGNTIKTPDGNPVVYDKIGDKFTLAGTDANGNILILNGNTVAMGKDGNFLKTVDDNYIVYDSKGNQVAQGADGNIVTDSKGNPLALDKDGNYIRNVFYDKDTGAKVDAEGKAAG